MVRPPDNHDEAAQVLDRGIVPASAFCENWQRMFLSSNAQTAPCCNHESVQSGSADRSVMGSGTNVQLLGVQKRIPVIDSSGLPDLACLCFFQAATFPAARLTDYRNTKPLFVKPRSQKQKISKPVALVRLVLRFFYAVYLLFFTRHRLMVCNFQKNKSKCKENRQTCNCYVDRSSRQLYNCNDYRSKEGSALGKNIIDAKIFSRILRRNNFGIIRPRQRLN